MNLPGFLRAGFARLAAAVRPARPCPAANPTAPQSSSPRPLAPHESGRAAQSLAEQTLTRSGHRILARNLSGLGGELDLVVSPLNDPRLIAVVEVRSHRPASGVSLYEILPPRKQKQVCETARRLLPCQPWFYADEPSSRRTHSTRSTRSLPTVRFDAVLVSLDDTGHPVRAEHLPDAFRSIRPNSW
jgi:Holliday junction resolvase-like predicted endonuclease